MKNRDQSDFIYLTLTTLVTSDFIYLTLTTLVTSDFIYLTLTTLVTSDYLSYINYSCNNVTFSILH